jgi:two-component system LytT family sensor kinase
MSPMHSTRLRPIVRAYVMSIAFWYGLSVLMGLQYSPLDRNHLWFSFLGLLVQAGARAFALALWTPPIFFLVNKYLRFSTNRVRYALLWGLGAAPFVFLHTAIAWLVIPPYVSRSFQSWLEIVRSAFADDTFVYIAIVVAAHGYEYLKCLRKEERERYEYQQALAASELQALKMQLHPHFLFNTLHGIATLIETDGRGAKDMIIRLSNLLRTALDRGSSDLIPLESELKFAREYLDLERMRFGTRLKVDWLIAPETLSFLVPQMILQPLVENAVRHGIASSREPGWIEVAATVSHGQLEVQVRNSAGSKASNGTGVGMRNVKARLKYLYSGDASLCFTMAENRMATASLTFPALNSQPAIMQGQQLQAVPEGNEYARSHR